MKPCLPAETLANRRSRSTDSIGRLSLFSEVKVVDAHGRELEAGKTGEIIGRSPNTVTSYFQNPEKSAETFRDGWLYTGDLGSFDADGFLYIRGRTKDMIITGGQNVHAAEVEEVLLRHDAIADCAVLGLRSAGSNWQDSRHPSRCSFKMKHCPEPLQGKCRSSCWLGDTGIAEG